MIVKIVGAAGVPKSELVEVLGFADIIRPLVGGNGYCHHKPLIWREAERLPYGSAGV